MQPVVTDFLPKSKSFASFICTNIFPQNHTPLMRTILLLLEPVKEKSLGSRESGDVDIAHFQGSFQ